MLTLKQVAWFTPECQPYFSDSKPKLTNYLAWFAPESVAYFSPESLAYFTPELLAWYSPE
jgi:hypothetical protein